MDLRELKKLINLMNTNGLTRLEVEEEGKRYRLEKGGAAAPVVSAAPVAAMAPAPIAAPEAKPAATEARPTFPEGSVTFNSPMVGTFYQASSPDVPPFVQIGDRITPDTVICVIEAMKVFNEIRPDTTGTVVEVLAENAEAVEYGQPLFLIRPD